MDIVKILISGKFNMIRKVSVLLIVATMMSGCSISLFSSPRVSRTETARPSTTEMMMTNSTHTQSLMLPNRQSASGNLPQNHKMLNRNMTTAQVISQWGFPRKVDQVIGFDGEYTRWTYPMEGSTGEILLFFKNDRLAYWNIGEASGTETAQQLPEG